MGKERGREKEGRGTDSRDLPGASNLSWDMGCTFLVVGKGLEGFQAMRDGGGGTSCNTLDKIAARPGGNGNKDVAVGVASISE